MRIQISACFFFRRDTFDIVFQWPFHELLRALPNNYLIPAMSHNQADSPKKSPIYIKKCKPNLNLKSHYIGQIEHCFVTLVSLMDIKGATKTERTEGARSWRHLCRTELISWQQPAHSAATPTRAPWTGKSLAAAHRRSTAREWRLLHASTARGCGDWRTAVARRRRAK